jgi:hypothetical protein
MGSNASETFKSVAEHLNAQHAESAVAELHRSLALSELVKQVHDGQIESEKVHAIAAILRNTSEVHIHRMRGGDNNSVYVSPDGHSEAVYDSDGKLVKDGINDGSYNYFHPQADALRHFSVDIAPWLLFGQSRRDPTTRTERVHAYIADLFEGVKRALETPQTTEAPDDVHLGEPGCAEAVAILLLAIERGDVEDLIRVVSLREKRSEQELFVLLGRFESGLQKVIAFDQAITATRDEEI